MSLFELMARALEYFGMILGHKPKEDRILWWVWTARNANFIEEIRPMGLGDYYVG